MSFAWIPKPFSPELQLLILEYLKAEVVPDRNSFVDDCDLAKIIDLLREENFIE